MSDKPQIPIDRIAQVPIGDLKPAEYNPRRSTEKQAKDLKLSLLSLGFIDPIIVNQHPGRENIIVGGHQRYYAAKQLGMETVPCVFVDFDETKEREANLRLNRNQGEWDWEALTAFEPQLLLEVGFMHMELVDHFNLGDGEEGDEKPEDSSIKVSVGPGDVFLLGDHLVRVGEVTDPEDIVFLLEKWQKKTKNKVKKLSGDEQTAYLANLSQPQKTS